MTSDQDSLSQSSAPEHSEPVLGQLHPSGPQAAAQTRILIIDDHPKLSRITALALGGMGCRTFLVDSTTAASRLLEQETIDGIFLDLNLGAESGLEFLAQMTRKASQPPVIMFTAEPTDEFAAEALRLGAIGCLVKPFKLDDLRRQVEKIENYRQLRDHP